MSAMWLVGVCILVTAESLPLHPWARRQQVTRRYLLGGLVAAEGIELARWSVLLVQGRWVD